MRSGVAAGMSASSVNPLVSELRDAASLGGSYGASYTGQQSYGQQQQQQQHYSQYGQQASGDDYQVSVSPRGRSFHPRGKSFHKRL